MSHGEADYDRATALRIADWCSGRAAKFQARAAVRRFWFPILRLRLLALASENDAIAFMLRNPSHGHKAPPEER
jgi:hypothetical protein